MVPRQEIRVAQASGGLHPLHIGMEIARQHARRIGRIKADLAIAVEVPADGGRRRIALANALAIRPIVKVHSPAIGGDGRGPVLAIVGEGPGLDRPRPVGVVIRGVAIGVIGDTHPADRVGGVRLVSCD